MAGACKNGKLCSMKIDFLTRSVLSCCLVLTLTHGAFADPTTWLSLLNSDGAGREIKLTEKDVVFAPTASPRFGDLVSVGYRQTDGTLLLGNIIVDGKVWSPLTGYVPLLEKAGFAEADDKHRQELFVELLRQTNEPLGTWVYEGKRGREESLPAPPAGYRQSDGQQRFVVWFCEEPGQREGPEWRRVLYLIDAQVKSIQVRTLGTFHPDAEGLRGYPPIPSRSSE